MDCIVVVCDADLIEDGLFLHMLPGALFVIQFNQPSYGLDCLLIKSKFCLLLTPCLGL